MKPRGLIPAMLAAYSFALPLVAEPQLRASQTLPVGTILTSAHLQPATDEPQFDIDLILGMETRQTIYAGEIIRPSSLSLPTLIEQNAPVTLLYQNGGLTIATDARALARASAGDIVQVLNLASRAIVSARIGHDGIARAAY